MRILIVIIVIVIVYYLMRRQHEYSHAVTTEAEMRDKMELALLNEKISHVLSDCGYKMTSPVKSHPTRTFASNKSETFVCTSCVGDEGGTDGESLLYLGLHETAHVLNTVGEEHGAEWEAIFLQLLRKGGDLNYLDAKRIRSPD